MEVVEEEEAEERWNASCVCVCVFCVCKCVAVGKRGEGLRLCRGLAEQQQRSGVLFVASAAACVSYTRGRAGGARVSGSLDVRVACESE